MLQHVFATKIGMSQAWTQEGKRLAVTKCKVDSNVVVAQHSLPQNSDSIILEIGFAPKKLKNMSKPLQGKLKKANIQQGVFGIKGVKLTPQEGDTVPQPGTAIKAEEVLQVGDIVKVQGVTKGRGFAGAMKRHGFSGGPATHGQSDRARAVGAIGNRTTPGRVFKNKRMPGHYGVETQTVAGLVVIHIDPVTQEVWLSGPVPGSISSVVRISKTGQTKDLTIDKKASGIKEEAPVEVAETAAETEVTETVPQE